MRKTLDNDNDASSNGAATDDGTMPSAQQEAIDTCNYCTASVAAMAMQTGESRDIKCQPTNNQPANDWLQQPLLLATTSNIRSYL